MNPTELPVLTEHIFKAENVQLSLFASYEPNFPDKQLYWNEINPAYFHTHEWYELFFVERGYITTLFDSGDPCIIKAGEFMCIHPGVQHYSMIPSSDNVCTVINFSYSIISQPCCVSWVQFLHFIRERHFQGDEECICLGRFIRNALDSGNLAAAILYLYALLNRASYLNNPADNNIYAILSDSSISRIYKIDSIIHKFYNTDIDLSVIAEELHISIRQLSRVIRKHYNCSFRQKITELRMQHAKRMLETGKSIAETAQETGYTSVKNFHTAFTKHENQTPGNFIRSTVSSPKPSSS